MYIDFAHNTLHFTIEPAMFTHAIVVLFDIMKNVQILAVEISSDKDWNDVMFEIILGKFSWSLNMKKIYLEYKYAERARFS